MRINSITNNYQSFCKRPVNVNDYIKKSFNIALSKSVIFPSTINKTADKLYKKFPANIEQIKQESNQAHFLRPLFISDAKELSYIQKLWTYLVKIPRELNKSL